jgi:hypothetical protein
MSEKDVVGRVLNDMDLHVKCDVADFTRDISH